MGRYIDRVYGIHGVFVVDNIGLKLASDWTHGGLRFHMIIYHPEPLSLLRRCFLRGVCGRTFRVHPLRSSRSELPGPSARPRRTWLNPRPRVSPKGLADRTAIPSPTASLIHFSSSSPAGDNTEADLCIHDGTICFVVFQEPASTPSDNPLGTRGV